MSDIGTLVEVGAAVLCLLMFVAFLLAFVPSPRSKE